MKRNEPGLIYHSLHRRGYRSCLPITFIISALVVTGALIVLNVRMPERIRSKGVGKIYYQNDELIHFLIRQRSPLPMNMPAYADPARQETAAAIETDGRADAKPIPAPPFNFLSTPPDSAVLDEKDLLALPPEQEKEDDKSERTEKLPSQGEEIPQGEEVQP